MDGLRKFKNFLQEFSIPLIAGVIGGLIFANFDEHAYHHWVDYPLFGANASIFGHPLTFHFLINDIFMVLFFGVAAKEITESVAPGGPLNPIKKAINPLLGTVGGVLGPALVYFALTAVFFVGHPDFGAVANGWGIPTATDIALAWLVARVVFGARHPAVNFLLLLAVADDAIGLGIIAIFYPDPNHPVNPVYLGVTGAGMAIAYVLRRFHVKSWVPYVVLGGGVSWTGLVLAALHPALALVFIVPFLPGPQRDDSLLDEWTDDVDAHTSPAHAHHSPLHDFEHQLKPVVDFGLFFFGFANAGVAFASLNAVTWIVLAALIVGKVVGITGMSLLGHRLGFSLPQGMSAKHLFVASIVAGLGLTVALFVAGQAFPNGSAYQGPAKMGAVFSSVAALIAIVCGRVLAVKQPEKSPARQTSSVKEPTLTPTPQYAYTSEDQHASHVG